MNEKIRAFFPPYWYLTLLAGGIIGLIFCSFSWGWAVPIGLFSGWVVSIGFRRWSLYRQIRYLKQLNQNNLIPLSLKDSITSCETAEKPLESVLGICLGKFQLDETLSKELSQPGKLPLGDFVGGFDE